MKEGAFAYTMCICPRCPAGQSLVGVNNIRKAQVESRIWIPTTIPLFNNNARAHSWTQTNWRNLHQTQGWQGIGWLAVRIIVCSRSRFVIVQIGDRRCWHIATNRLGNSRLAVFMITSYLPLFQSPTTNLARIFPSSRLDVRVGSGPYSGAVF